MGQQIFDSNGNFTVPEGITELNICMCGGGGSGSSSRADSGVNNYSGGGNAGSEISDSIAVVPLAVIPIVVGIGGEAYLPSGNENGRPGTDSTIDILTALGGAGGIQSSDPSVSYPGNGGSKTGCGGAYTDGLSQEQTIAPGNYTLQYGGEASPFSNGANGAFDGSAIDPGQGAGSGGTAWLGADPINNTKAGGNGRVVVNWDDAPTGLPEFRINGSIIPADAGTVKFGDENGNVYSVDRVFENGEEVWTKIGVSGSVEIDYDALGGQNPETVVGGAGSFTFTVPENITSISYEVYGAGGSGGGGAGGEGNTDAGDGDGGYGGGAGLLVTGTLAVLETETYAITIGLPSGSVGLGGDGADSCSGSEEAGTVGFVGGSSTFHTFTSAGGSAGGKGSGTGGRNATAGQSTPEGTGGAAGSGDGGVGGNASARGAGGGAGNGGDGHNCDSGDDGGNGGLGANGFVRIIW